MLPQGYPAHRPQRHAAASMDTGAQWKIGGVAEVTFTIENNHGGGYAQLCPAGEPLTEEVGHHLEFDTGAQGIVYKEMGGGAWVAVAGEFVTEGCTRPGAWAKLPVPSTALGPRCIAGPNDTQTPWLRGVGKGARRRPVQAVSGDRRLRRRATTTPGTASPCSQSRATCKEAARQGRPRRRQGARDAEAGQVRAGLAVGLRGDGAGVVRLRGRGARRVGYVECMKISVPRLGSATPSMRGLSSTIYDGERPPRNSGSVAGHPGDTAGGPTTADSGRRRVVQPRRSQLTTPRRSLHMPGRGGKGGRGGGGPVKLDKLGGR